LGRVLIGPLGTYFGTKEEYDALQFEQRLGKNATVQVIQLDNWLGTVAKWAESEALRLIGSLVRLYSLFGECAGVAHFLIYSLDHFTPRVWRSPKIHLYL
jgi:hypothetical protein